MRWFAVLVLVGCGRLSFDARPLDDGGAGDGDGATGDGGTLACNLATRVFDDFQGATLDPDVWGGSYSNGTSTLGLVGGDAVITPAMNMASTYAGVRSYRMYDMRGQRFVGEVSQVASSLSVTGLQLEYDTSNYISISQFNGNLRAAYAAQGAGYIDVMTMPYVAAQHRYFALSETGGVIHFDSSPDGTTFTPFATLPAFVDLSLVRLIAYAGTDNPVAAPGAAHFARLGLISGATTGGACPATTLTDTFEAPTFAHVWDISSMDPCCTIAHTSGRVRMTTDGQTGNVVLRSVAGVDLTESEVRVELVTAPLAANTHMALIVRRATQNYVELQVNSTDTLARYLLAGVPSNMSEARNVNERFLRISQTGGMLVWSVSTDGTTWRTLRSVTPPFPLDDVVVVLRLETVVASTADAIEFDNFNVP